MLLGAELLGKFHRLAQTINNGVSQPDLFAFIHYVDYDGKWRWMCMNFVSFNLTQNECFMHTCVIYSSILHIKDDDIKELSICSFTLLEIAQQIPHMPHSLRYLYHI